MKKIFDEEAIVHFWNIHPNLRFIVKRALLWSAKINMNFGRKVGKVYTLLFSVLGTSWYDHRFDYLRGIENYHWLERPFNTLNRMNEKDVLLDIGCGDGLYDGVFYSKKASKIMAIDKDKEAIKHARKHYSRKNVNFAVEDVFEFKFKENYFDLVTLYAVIEHFSESDGLIILKKIKKSLKKGGVLLGSTPIFPKNKKSLSNWEHENEFTSVKELNKFLSRVFKKIVLKKSIWGKKRTDYYFECYK